MTTVTTGTGTRRYDTTKPVISDRQLGEIRALAHQYVLAGGGGSCPPTSTRPPSANSSAPSARCGRPKVEETFNDTLEHVVPMDGARREGHDQAWAAAWHLVAAEGEAGFMFGVCVGLELMALAGPLTARTSRGGAR